MEAIVPTPIDVYDLNGLNHTQLEFLYFTGNDGLTRLIPPDGYTGFLLLRPQKTSFFIHPPTNIICDDRPQALVLVNNLPLQSKNHVPLNLRAMHHMSEFFNFTLIEPYAIGDTTTDPQPPVLVLNKYNTFRLPPPGIWSPYDLYDWSLWTPRSRCVNPSGLAQISHITTPMPLYLLEQWLSTEPDKKREVFDFHFVSDDGVKKFIYWILTQPDPKSQVTREQVIQSYFQLRYKGNIQFFDNMIVFPNIFEQKRLLDNGSIKGLTDFLGYQPKLVIKT